MFKSMIKKDFIRNKAINITLLLFLILAAFLMASGTIIIIQLTDSMNGLFEKAQPPHFMQMHSGEIDQDAIEEFTGSIDYVTAQQTVEMVNIDGANIWLLTGGSDNSKKTTMSDSMMDNGFVKQNEKFDFLLDMDNDIIHLNPGEIGVPVSYMQSYGLVIGDKLILSEHSISREFVITGFVRDAQMASSLASSVRFLVSDEDFKQIIQNIGEKEYLVEFLLTDNKLTGELQGRYEAEELEMPTNGPAVTYNLFKLMNAFADGIMAAVIIMVSFLLVFIAMLILRFTILATLEEELKEIGVMKAIGIAYKDIKRLYLLKYIAVTISGCMIGYALALPASNLFTTNIAVNFGRQGLTMTSFLMPILSVTLVYLIVIHFCKNTLKNVERITVVQALVTGTNYRSKKNRFRKWKSKEKVFSVGGFGKAPVNFILSIRELSIKAKSWFLLLFVFVLATCIIIIPLNLLNTFESPTFASYMGTALADIRIDLQTEEKLQDKSREISDTLEKDSDISSFQLFATCRYEVYGEEGWDTIRVECGDYSDSNMTYLSGNGPKITGEIAVSSLNSEKLRVDIGDAVKLRIEGIEKVYTVCGIYQDVTNGGYTAKMMYDYEVDDVLWYTYFIHVGENVPVDKTAENYAGEFSYAKVIPMDAYMSQTLGTITASLSQAVLVVSFMAVFIAALITVLFLNLQLVKDYAQIATLKAIGFSVLDIRKQYLIKIGIVAVIGILFGTVISNTLGESFISAMLSVSGLGMSQVSFVINPFESYLLYPALLIFVVIAATWISSDSVKRYNIIQLIQE